MKNANNQLIEEKKLHKDAIKFNQKKLKKVKNIEQLKKYVSLHKGNKDAIWYTAITLKMLEI